MEKIYIEIGNNLKEVLLRVLQDREWRSSYLFSECFKAMREFVEKTEKAKKK